MAIGRIPEPLAGIQESILDAKGDLVTATAADTPARLAVGTNNQTLIADSTQSTGLKWGASATSTLTAKGDLLTATAANTIARLGVGANGTTLVADSAEATGLKWATAASGGANWSLLNSGGTSLSGTTTTVSGISGKDKILILVNGSTNTDNSITVRFNGDTGNNYYNYGVLWGRTNNYGFFDDPGSYVQLAYISSASHSVFGSVLLTGANSSGVKVYQALGGGTDNASNAQNAITGWYNSASTISSISVFATNSGVFDNGRVFVYTSA